MKKMIDIEKYKGLQIADRLEGMARECYIACWEWMKFAWGNNVEFERMANHVLLCDETYDYLYKNSPPKIRYIRGTRPVLEKIADEICKDCKTEREKVLAILSYIRDMHKEVNGADYFFGGTEEELIKKSEWFCERVARVMVGLCEVVGIPGRIIFHVAGGHVTNEIYLEGKWSYFDPRWGNFYMDGDKFLSVDEISKNREVIYNQTDFVKSFRTDYLSLDYLEHRTYHFYLSPREIQCIGDYSLMDADKYHFGWVPCYQAPPSPNMRAADARYRETGLMHLMV